VPNKKLPNKNYLLIHQTKNSICLVNQTQSLLGIYNAMTGKCDESMFDASLSTFTRRITHRQIFEADLEDSILIVPNHKTPVYISP